MREFIVATPPRSKFQASISDFRNARKRAAMENIVDRLTGKSTELLSFNQVVNQLKMVGRAERGIQDIPLDAIVGSVGRYTDFTRTFLPQRESDAQRWAGVASVENFHQLPPIDVYQIGDVYFVLDGNHRVSIARQRGMISIPAEVTEVRTRAPIPPELSPDKLILQAEYVDFLENTNLDRLRPDADLRVSVPGQYRKLENHMEVHRFFIEMAGEIELSDEEAVTRWFDEAYLPVVEAIRDQGILRGFPHRTETDLYLWISEHQAHLRNELGWEVRPEVATADLAGRMAQQTEGKITRLGKEIGRSVLNIVMPGASDTRPPAPSWSQQKVAARYSDRLFADLLVVLPDGYDNQATLDQALIIAHRDDSRLHGLCPGTDTVQPNIISDLSPSRQDTPATSLKSWFEGQCREASVEGQISFQAGNPVEVIQARAALVDLIIIGRPTKEAGTEAVTAAEEQSLSLVRTSPRPILISTDRAVPLENVLLAYDGSPKSKEALFAAAYMAERWGVSLTVVLAPEDENGAASAVNHAQDYLEMHEVTADYVVCDADPASLILDTAGEKAAQLIVAGGFSEGRFGRLGTGSVIGRLVSEWQGALLICP